MLRYRLIVLDQASGREAFLEISVSEEFVSGAGEKAVFEELVRMAPRNKALRQTPDWTPLEVWRWDESAGGGSFVPRATFVDGVWVSATDDPITPRAR